MQGQSGGVKVVRREGCMCRADFCWSADYGVLGGKRDGGVGYF